MSTAKKTALDTVLEETIQVYGTKENITITMEEVRLLIATPTKSGKLPSDREIMLFLKICKARGFNPYAKEVFLIGYDNKDGAKFETVVALPAMLKRAEGNPGYEGKEYGVLVWDKATSKVVELTGDCIPTTMSVVGGWCRVHRKGRMPEYATASNKAYAKQFGHWAIDPNWMIAKCAIAKALRQAFPSDVGDLTIQEEMGAMEQADKRQQLRSGSLSQRLAELAEATEARHPVDKPHLPQPVKEEEHGDAWEPDEEERASIEGQLFETHPNAAEA
jgi:phage recombination protein Bet